MIGPLAQSTTGPKGQATIQIQGCGTPGPLATIIKSGVKGVYEGGEDTKASWAWLLGFHKPCKMGLAAARMVERSLEEVEVDQRDRHGRTALMWAADTGQVEAAEALLALGADRRACDLQTGRRGARPVLKFGCEGCEDISLARGTACSSAIRRRCGLLMGQYGSKAGAGCNAHSTGACK